MNMNVKSFVHLARRIIVSDFQPNTVLILPSATLRDERVLSNLNIIGNYNIRFTKLNNTPIWWSDAIIDPRILSTTLDDRFQHSNSLVLKIDNNSGNK